MPVRIFRMTSVLILWCGIFWCGVSAPAVAAASQRPTNPPYLASMPDEPRVLSLVTGADAIDTAARQAGVFWQLRQIIIRIANSQRRPERLHTPDENRLKDLYWQAWGRAWKVVQTAVGEDKPRLFTLEGYTADHQLLNDLLTRAGATGAIAEYAKADETFARWREQEAKAGAASLAAGNTERARAEAEFKQMLADVERQAEKRRPFVRCIAAGRDETECLTEALGRESPIAGLFMAGARVAPGLSLSGSYAGSAGLSFTFYPDSVVIVCSGVSTIAGYRIDHSRAGTIVRLLAPELDTGLPFANHELLRSMLPRTSPVDRELWQDQRITLSAQPGGGFAATRLSPQPAASIDVTGEVRTGTGRTREGETVTLYESRTRTCPLGALRLAGPASPFGSGSTAVAASFNLVTQSMAGATPSSKVPPPGFRMAGRFSGQTGLELEFHPETVIVGCRNAMVARSYEVRIAGAERRVVIQHGTSPLVFEIQPDGTLSGAGRVTVDGRWPAGQDASGAVVFQPVTDACASGVLSAAR
jgi:hypothetical protein